MLPKINNKWIVTFDTIRGKMQLEDIAFRLYACVHMFYFKLTNFCTKDVVKNNFMKKNLMKNDVSI